MTALLLALAGAAACSDGGAAPDAAPQTTATTGTGGQGEPAPSATATPVAAPTEIGGCLTSADGELLVDEGASSRAEVALLGSGTVGVVVSYETSRNVCSWLPLADQLVEAGYLVLLQDGIAGTGTQHAVDRVALLRERGIEDVVLVGGSIGGAASINAAAEVEPPVAAVVSLSGGGADMAESAAALTMPVLQVVASGDQPFAELARANDTLLTRSSDHVLLELPGNAHASAFFTTDQSAEVLAAVLDFLLEHVPA